MMMYTVPGVVPPEPNSAWERYAVRSIARTKHKGSKDPETKKRKVAQDAENRASFFHSFKETNSIYNAETRIELCERPTYREENIVILFPIFPYRESIVVAPHDYVYCLRLLTGCYVRRSTPPIAQLHRSAHTTHTLYVQRSRRSIE